MLNPNNILQMLQAKDFENIEKLLEQENVSPNQVLTIIKILSAIKAALEEALIITTQQQQDWNFLINQTIKILPNILAEMNLTVDKIPRSLILAILLHTLTELSITLSSLTQD